VKEFLKPNDLVIVGNIESSDIWLKFKLSLNWNTSSGGGGKGKTLESEMELRIEKSLTGQLFQQVIQKLSLYIFNQHQNEQSSKKFVLTDFKIFKVDKEKKKSDAKIGKKTDSGSKQRKVSLKSKYEVPMDKSVGEVFTFESNYVKVECIFTSVRELYYQQVTSSTASRFNISADATAQLYPTNPSGSNNQDFSYNTGNSQVRRNS
jgi:hypothetical protein